MAFATLSRRGETFANGHGQVYNNNRDWEDRNRQTLAVRQNCPLHARCELHRLLQLENFTSKTASLPGKPQQTDYPRTRPDLPNHEPRGCPRGASYSWYLYSANRLKYPLRGVND
ncbi:hypothetical protein [Klebsiella pneumoniae]|uniref:hypothetical protein n=1 Tax=Klebsiella pneumoniae TaxID=573 RepID=UPI003A943AF3